MPTAVFDSDDEPAGETETPFAHQQPLTGSVSITNVNVTGGGSITPMPLTGVVPPPADEPSPVILDPRFALERALIDMVEVSRRKRADYATDDDEFSNFRGTAEFAGFETPALSALFNVAQKMERIRALRANGRMAEPSNEAVEDTFLDLAVYGVLAFAMYLEGKDSGEDHA